MASGVAADSVMPLQTLPAMIARLNPDQKEALESNPDVVSVEPDAKVKATSIESDPPWGLDRIDQAGSDLDSKYHYYATGSGVTVYVFDSGVYAGNSEFEGRVVSGFSAYGGTSDYYGHGTHVAGTIAGKTYGVAKKAKIVAVKILDDEGNGWKSDTIRAVDWVIGHHTAGTPAVANLSLGGGYSYDENWAIEQLVADGVTVAVSAGNSTADACSQSPASAASALTVASTDFDDEQSSYSNYGSCVDLYAPGRDILSASLSQGSGVLKSGTSMASPHVAGVAALVLSSHPKWSPAQVTSRIIGMTQKWEVWNTVGGTPNRLLSVAPDLDDLSQYAGRVSGGQSLQLWGSGFYDVTKVTFDKSSAKQVSVRSDEVLTLRTPKHKAGSVRITVKTRLGRSRTLAFRYVNAPSVSSVRGSNGTMLGGTSVTIKGKNLNDVDSVYFGKTRAAGFSRISSTKISVTSPAHAVGKVSVKVSGPGGTSKANKHAVFTYKQVPVITSVSPSSGWVEGGNTITIGGSSFAKVSAVTFGGTPATFTVVSTSKITAKVPAHSSGTVDVRVATGVGPSAVTAETRYTYVSHPGPTISSVVPNSGPTAGGTTVTINGGNFTGISAVIFGDTPAASYHVVSATQITAVAPAHAAGTLDIRVTGTYGQSVPVGGDQFTFVAPTPPPSPATVRVMAGATMISSSCTSSRCRWVVVQTANFDSNVTCRIVDSDFGAWGATWVQGPNETRQSPNYFGGTFIRVSCNGVVGSTSWP